MKTLFERLGGAPAISGVVRQFYRDVINSPILKHHFEGTDMPKLIDHQTKFLCHVLGGPADYTGQSLAVSHRHLGITPAEFDEVAEILQETLEDFDLSHADIASVMSIVASSRADIVSGS
jgi:hemoglobin